MTEHALYGQIPLELAPHADGSIQFSPQIPGSAKLEDCAEATLSNVLMHAPPGTLERRYALALALRALRPGGVLTAMAGKEKGGARIKAELESFGCNVSEDARRHFRICRCTKVENAAGLTQAINDGGLRLMDDSSLWSQPGIFSWDRIDRGSAILANFITDLSGLGADFGCGSGFLAKTALRSPSVRQLRLFDLDRRALDCARLNVVDTRASFDWVDIGQGSAVRDELDFVVMNPPFHALGQEDRNLGQRFIECAYSALRPSGTLWITANRHLPYEETLTKLFERVTAKADMDGYKIYVAVK